MSSKLSEFPALDGDVLPCHGVVKVSCLADPSMVLGSGMRCMRRAALGVHRHGGPVLLPTLRRHLLSRSVHTAREPLAGREKPDVLAACLQWASFLVVPESLRARAATRPGYVSETLDGSGSALHDTGQSTGHLSLPRSRGGLPCGHWKLTENNWRAK